MQTYTHLLVGLCIGTLAFRDDSTEILACTAGSTLPDLVMVPLFVLDTLRGRKPLAQQGPALRVLKNLSHSAPLWFILMFVGKWTHPVLSVMGFVLLAP